MSLIAHWYWLLYVFSVFLIFSEKVGNYFEYSHTQKVCLYIFCHYNDDYKRSNKIKAKVENRIQLYNSKYERSFLYPIQLLEATKILYNEE